MQSPSGEKTWSNVSGRDSTLWPGDNNTMHELPNGQGTQLLLFCYSTVQYGTVL